LYRRSERVRPKERPVQFHPGDRVPRVVDLVQGDARLEDGRPRIRHHLEEVAVLRDVLHLVPEEEAVVQGGQRLFLRQFRGRAHQCLEGALQHLAIVVEESLVDQGQEAVQDRAVRLPDLVEEREVRLREVAAGQPREPVLLEGRDGHGTEELVGQGEARQ